MIKRRYLDYKDTFITIFNDSDKLCVVFLNDKGKTQAINYDDNFFYVEYLIDTYYDFIVDSFKGWKNNKLYKSDWEEIFSHLLKYIKHLKRQSDDLDFEAVSKEVRNKIEGDKIYGKILRQFNQ